MYNIKLLALLLAAAALFAVGCDREISGGHEEGSFENEQCFDCHNGQLDQAQGEWANSVHASGNNVDYTNRGGSDCTMCHDQQGFIQFQETGELPDEPFSTVSAIGCFTCHNPHENGDFSLRATDPVVLANGDVFNHEAGNLCVACHHSRRSADGITDDASVNRYWGPHRGPQGDMLNGSNGWEFPGLGYDIEDSPHDTAIRDACAGCHMGNVRAHDGYDIGGHSWNMVNEETGSNLSALCEDCHDGANDYDFLADDDYDGDGVTEGNQTEFDGLLDDLRQLLVAQGVLDGSDHPLSQTIADQHVTGALYNFLFALEDRSRGVHNFEYAISLLSASIDYVSGLPAGAPIAGRAPQAAVASH